jgi:hypothetical protein
MPLMPLKPKERKHVELSIDYFKHITTLSTGAIVIIAAFVEKLAQYPRCRFLLPIAIGGFAVSIVAAVIAHTYEIDRVLNDTLVIENRFELLVSLGSLLAMWIAFLVGIVSLAIFAACNC